MVVDLIKLGNSEKHFEIEIKPLEINLESEFVKLNSPAQFNGKLKNSDSRVEVQGNISAELALDCSRCLQAVSKEFKFDFENAYVTAENYTEEQEIELEIKDLEVSIFEGDKIDLKEIAREQILLALPSQILCSENCKGLCEKCGTNLNNNDCKCAEKEVDPRWAALGKLKIDNE